MADIKAKVIDNRTTRARLGQVGAIKVLSQQTGSASKLANLSDVDRASVLGGNAARIFGLGI